MAPTASAEVATANEGVAASSSTLVPHLLPHQTPLPAYIPKSPNQISTPLTSTKYRTTKQGSAKRESPSAALCIEEREFAGPNRRRTDKIALGARHGEKRRGGGRRNETLRNGEERFPIF